MKNVLNFTRFSGRQQQPAHKKLILLFQLMMLSLFTFGQAPIQCWDFEEGCSDPHNAFFLGCIPDAISASGQPGNQSFPGVQAFSGAKYANLFTSYCYPGGTTAFTRGDGIILEHNFEEGKKVIIEFAQYEVVESNTTELKLVGTSGRPNISDPFSPFPCTAAGTIPPINLPFDDLIFTFTPSSIPNGVWTTRSVPYTPSRNHTQLWFRPATNGQIQQQSLKNYTLIDKVCIIDPCAPTPHTVSVCQYAGSSSVVATINGVNIPANEWTLGTAFSCNGGAGLGNLSSILSNINWLVSGSSFSLPANSGCYILFRTVNKPECHQPPTVVSFLFNTGSDGTGIPQCSGPCDDWRISKIEEPETIQFSILPSPPATSFPSGTTFTFRVDGIVQQTGTSQIFEIFPGQFPPGTHTLCVTVLQPGCPDIQKCTTFTITNAAKFRNAGSQKDGSDLKISNPSSGAIWLSIAFEEGEAYLYSSQGSLVKTYQLNNSNYLDVAGLPVGQYFLKIKTTDFSVSKLVLIKN